jgi:hypothetical protein
VPLDCDLATESCGAPLCEGEQPCSATAGALVPLVNREPDGVCYHDGEVLLVEDGALRRLGWPDLVARQSHRLGGTLVGDCAVIDGVVYYPDVSAGSIGTLVLSTGAVSPYAFGTPSAEPRAVAADQGALWVAADATPMLSRISTKGEFQREIPNTGVTNACDGLEATVSGLWCLDLAGKVLFKLSKEDGTVLAGPFFGPPVMGLALIDGTLWGASTGMVYDAQGGLTGSSGSVGGLVPFELQGVLP